VKWTSVFNVLKDFNLKTNGRDPTKRVKTDEFSGNQLTDKHSMVYAVKEKRIDFALGQKMFILYQLESGSGR